MPDKKRNGESRIKRPPLSAVDIARAHTEAGWRASFATFSKRTSGAVGSPVMFLIALAVVLTWGITGPMFGFSDTWQLIINTGTTIVTFLMVFLIQATQNRDAKALHFKLDELIHAVHGAHEELIDVEDLSDEELDELGEHYHQVRAEETGRTDRRATPKAGSKRNGKRNGRSKPAA
ncbi:MAG: low affinity iron permease family protein [Terriglobales bacterium]